MTAGRMMRMGVGGAGDYSVKVLGHGPIAYWPLWEAAGAAAECLVNSPAQDGTYHNVTLGQAGIGDGNTCPLFNGTTGFVDVLSAALQTAWDGDELSVMIWLKVFNAGVWEDFAHRAADHFNAGSQNRIHHRKTSAADQFTDYTNIGNVVNQYINSESRTGWMVRVITSSDTDEEMKSYVNGVQITPTRTPVGTWSVGDITLARIGSYDAVNFWGWYGWLAHCAVWDRALSPATILSLASV